MSVSPRHRRRGIGGALIKVVLEHAKKHGISKIRLVTSVLQPDAISLYERHGWVFTGVLSSLNYMAFGEEIESLEYEKFLQ